MGANNFKPHVFVLPEDDANSDIANGFFLEIPLERQTAFRILGPAKGWRKTIDRACDGDCEGLRSYPSRHLVLLIDFDNEAGRLEEIRTRIPKDLAGRIFILGSLSEPEDLRKTLGNYENIGKMLAADCRDDTDFTWSHKLLANNRDELTRSRNVLRKLLF